MMQELEPGLNLEFALNYEHLADRMIDAIKAQWHSPLDSPTVIFPDRHLEQWFRLRWIANPKNGALANLRVRFLDDFVFEILAGNGKNKKIKRLSADILRNAMMTWLTEMDETGENQRYQSLSPRVRQYLENTDQKGINENRLFDFATIMSGLFLEYETTRPGRFIQKHQDGLLDCWNRGKYTRFFTTDDTNDGPDEDWQYKLYSAMFYGEDGQKPMIERFAPDGVQYRTIAQMYAAIRDDVHGTAFYAGEAPVFLFWHAGMGQVYRVILDDFARSHTVFAFVQNPCMEFWEDVKCFPERMHRKEKFAWTWNQNNCPKDKLNLDCLSDENESDIKDENTLLRKWGRAGRDNIRLWCSASQYRFEFAEEAMETPENAPLLKQVQCMVAHRVDVFQDGYSVNETGGRYFENDASLSLTGAPSRLREIEALHSRICALLQDNTKDVRLNDIIVMAPDIESYRPAIYEVFDQTQPGDKENLRIPFTVVGSESFDSMTSRALHGLFEIQRNKSLTRPLFFELVRNPIVQAVRGIEPDFVASWENWIDAMHIYRDLTECPNGWMNGVRRMLAARFSACRVGNDEHDYEPFADLDSGNPDSLCAFSRCIQDLETWIGMRNSAVDEDMLARTMEFVRSWIALPEIPKGMGCEYIVYQRIAESAELLESMFRTGKTALSWECVSQTLEAAASNSELPGGKLFARGITFMQFQAARIVPVKYLFFIGADAMKFPGTGEARSLDLRQCTTRWPGDTQPADRNRYGFLCQLMCTGEQFHISYVNCDLQKDKAFYPSSPIHDIRDMLCNAAETYLKDAGKLKEEEKIDREHVWPVTEIPLDEKRDWSELFTPRAFRNKAAYLKMIEKEQRQKEKPKDADSQNAQNESHKTHPRERVSLYQIRQFLEDPFRCYVSQILLNDEEDTTDEEFEPIALDNLQSSNALKQCVQHILQNGDESKETFFEEFNDLFPNGIFGRIEKDNLWNSASSIAHQMRDELKIRDIKFDNICSVEMRTEDGKSWTLQGNRLWYTHVDDPHRDEQITAHTLSIYRVAAKEKKDRKDFIPLYVTALSLLAEPQDDSNTSWNVSMRIICPMKDYQDSFSITPEEAQKRLQSIYERMETEHRCIPAEWLEKTDDHNTFAKYRDGLTGYNSPWQYFDKKDLFNLDKDVGFHEETFSDDWNDATVAQNRLFWNVEK